MIDESQPGAEAIIKSQSTLDGKVMLDLGIHSGLTEASARSPRGDRGRGQIADRGALSKRIEYGRYILTLVY